MILDNKSLARILQYVADGFTMAAEIIDPQSTKTKRKES